MKKALQMLVGIPIGAAAGFVFGLLGAHLLR